MQSLIEMISAARPDAPQEEVSQRVLFIINNNADEHASALIHVPVDKMQAVLDQLNPPTPKPESKPAGVYPTMSDQKPLVTSEGYPTMKAERPKEMYPSLAQK